MFSVIIKLSKEFNKGLDEAKLIEFEKRINLVNEIILEEYCEEIHMIMQRHYMNKEIIIKSKKLLLIIEEIKKNKVFKSKRKTYNW